MLAGGPGGFSLADSFSRGELPHPAALASVLRGQQLEIYGVNEHGSQAVLVTALVDSALRPPDRSPIPLAGLLLVVGPGFELAMSVLTADPIAVDPQIPGTVLVAKAGDGDSAPPFVDGAGSGERTPDENAEQKPESDPKDGEDRQAHDAAILELLSGVDDALEFRPPKLPLEQSNAVQPEEPPADAGGQEPSAQPLKAIFAWVTSPNVARVVGQLPLPPGLGAVTEAALAVVRGRFPGFAASETASVAVSNESVPDAAGVDDALVDTDSSTTDPWLAAACALGLASRAWTIKREPSECEQSKPRRARFPSRPRPPS
jgi:hypothetical protein